jgi:hypothetical protein
MHRCLIDEGFHQDAALVGASFCLASQPLFKYVNFALWENCDGNGKGAQDAYTDLQNPRQPEMPVILGLQPGHDDADEERRFKGALSMV